MRKLLVLSLLLFAVAACKKKAEVPPKGAPGKSAVTAPKKVATPPMQPAVAMGEVVGRGTIGSVDGFISAIEPYLAAMGASMTTIAGIKATAGKWIGLASWDGVDGARPIHLWLLNPKKFRAPIIVGLPTRSGKALQARPGWASRTVSGYTLLGKRAAAVAAIVGSAQRDIARKARVPASGLMFRLKVAKLIAAYEPELQRLLGRMTRLVGGGGRDGGDSQKFLGWLVKALVDVGKQLDTARAELEPAKDLARITLRLTPRPGTGLAKFLASSREPSAEVLSRIPAQVAGALAVSFAPSVLERLVEQVAAHMASSGGPVSVTKLMRMVIAPLMKSLRGDMAFAKQTTTGGPTMLLFGVRDQQKALAGLRDVFRRMGDMGGMAMGAMRIDTKVSFQPKVGTYRGTSYDRMRVSYDYSKMPKFQARLFKRLMGSAQDTYLAATGDYVVVVGTRGETDQPMRAALDHLAAKGAQGLDQRAEFKELRSKLPPKAFGLVYFSLVDYLKTAFSALAAGGMMPGGLASITSEGYLGASLSAPGGSLQVDVIASRTHIEAIRKLFKALRAKRPGPGMIPPGRKIP